MSRRRMAVEVLAFATFAVLAAWSATLVKTEHTLRRAEIPALLARSEARSVAGAGSGASAMRSAASLDGSGAEIGAADDASVDEAEPLTAGADASIRWFDGQAMRPTRTIWMRVTAYSPDAESCAPFDDGITASLKSVWTNGMRLVAADPKVLPIGSVVSVPGYAGGELVPVLDKGGAIKGNRLDVLYPTHGIALRWGVRDLAVTVWGPVAPGD